MGEGSQAEGFVTRHTAVPTAVVNYCCFTLSIQCYVCENHFKGKEIGLVCSAAGVTVNGVAPAVDGMSAVVPVVVGGVTSGCPYR